MVLVVDNMAGKCSDDCFCTDFDDALDDTLEACQMACLGDETCLSVEYEDNWDHDCKLCTNVCSIDLESSSHHWCYTRTNITMMTTMGKTTVNQNFLK